MAPSIFHLPSRFRGAVIGGFLPAVTLAFRRAIAYRRGVTSRVRHRRRSPRVGGFLLRRGDGGCGGQGHFTVQEPGQRVSVNAPSSTDATGKARGVAAPTRQGWGGYIHDRRRLPRGVVRSFNHRQHRMVAAMAKRRTTFNRPAARFIALRKRVAVCFFALGSSRPENPSPRLKIGSLFPLAGDRRAVSFQRPD